MAVSKGVMAVSKGVMAVSKNGVILDELFETAINFLKQL
jgi:hypothetical protein